MENLSWTLVYPYIKNTQKPLCLNQKDRVREEHKQIKGSHITLTIHPSISTNKVTKEEQAMPARVQKIIEKALPPENLRKQKCTV